MKIPEQEPGRIKNFKARGKRRNRAKNAPYAGTEQMHMTKEAPEC